MKFSFLQEVSSFPLAQKAVGFLAKMSNDLDKQMQLSSSGGNIVIRSENWKCTYFTKSFSCKLNATGFSTFQYILFAYSSAKILRLVIVPLFIVVDKCNLQCFPRGSWDGILTWIQWQFSSNLQQPIVNMGRRKEERRKKCPCTHTCWEAQHARAHQWWSLEHWQWLCPFTCTSLPLTIHRDRKFAPMFATCK